MVIHVPIETDQEVTVGICCSNSSFSTDLLIIINTPSSEYLYERIKGANIQTTLEVLIYYYS